MQYFFKGDKTTEPQSVVIKVATLDYNYTYLPELLTSWGKKCTLVL